MSNYRPAITAAEMAKVRADAREEGYKRFESERDDLRRQLAEMTAQRDALRQQARKEHWPFALHEDVERLETALAEARREVEAVRAELRNFELNGSDAVKQIRGIYADLAAPADETALREFMLEAVHRDRQTEEADAEDVVDPILKGEPRRSK